MELKTDRLRLRDIKQSDLDNLVRNYNNLNVAQHLYLNPYPPTSEVVMEYILKWGSEAEEQPRKNFNLGIEYDKRVIGLVQLLSVDELQGLASIGFSLAEPYWRRGITTEAARELIRFGFEELGLRRIDAEVNVGNTGSNGILKKLGFCLEGTRKQYRKMKSTEKIHDVLIYGLLKEEWEIAKK